MINLSLPVVLVVLLILGALVFFLVGNAKTRGIAARAEALVPPVGTIQPVEGGAIHHVDIGRKDGPALVMIHGLGGYLQHFTYALTERLEDDFRLIVLDRPGCGYSSRDDATKAGLAEQARMIWDFLDKLGVSNPILVGHSLGGAISLAMALHRPGDTRALALLAPLTHPARAPSPALAGLNIPNPFKRQLLAYSWAIPGAQAAADASLDAIFGPDSCPEDFLRRGAGALGLRPQAFLAMVEDYCASDRDIAAQARKYPKHLRTKGSVLFGDDDQVLDPAQHGAPMMAFGLDAKTAPGHGHMLPIIAADKCETFIRNIADSADAA